MSISTGDDKLVAEGNVEALYKGQRLQASAKSITYDRTTETLHIDRADHAG